MSAARDLESRFPELLAAGADAACGNGASAAAPARDVAGRLLPVLLGDDGRAVVATSWHPGIRSAVVAYATGLRLARFSASNDVGDWFSARHTFIFANAVDRAGYGATP